MHAAVALHEAAVHIESLELPEDAAETVQRIAVELRNLGDSLKGEGLRRTEPPG